MEEFFTEIQSQPQTQFEYNPPQQPQQTFQFVEAPITTSTENIQPSYEFNNYSSQIQTNEPNEDNENEFNDFEEDQVTRKIKQQQQRIQTLLADKSQKEWEEKQKRQQEGRKQLEDYKTKKEQEKVDRAADNIKKETENREEYAKLNVAAGWKKVVSNINVRQGERKGTKDINRMREAILHKKEDDSS